MAALTNGVRMQKKPVPRRQSLVASDTPGIAASLGVYPGNSRNSLRLYAGAGKICAMIFPSSWDCLPLLHTH
jgi:hypothetical protein